MTETALPGGIEGISGRFMNSYPQSIRSEMARQDSDHAVPLLGGSGCGKILVSLCVVGQRLVWSRGPLVSL